LVDGATSVVVTATCRPRDWPIFICGQLDVRSTNSFERIRGSFLFTCRKIAVA
jgi:hypothetical protein